MLQLYDLNKAKLHGLTSYRDFKVERELSGEEMLSFLYPQCDSKYSSIVEECYIRTEQNEYVVKEKNIQDDWTEFIAKINVEDLKGTTFDRFETIEQTCADTVNLALVGTGWTIGSCDVTKKRTVRKSKCSSYDILNEIRNIYLCDFKFDAINKKLFVYQSMGSDKGSYFIEELNLKNLIVQSNSYDYCTRIIPIGKDGLQINDINNGIEHVENYQYSNKIITIYWEDNRYTVAENLKEDAEYKLNELSKPIKAYSAEIIDLAAMNDKYKDIIDYDLGDTISLTSKDKNVKEKQRIVKLIEYTEEPERNSCEIANRTLKLEDIQKESLDAAETVGTITTSDGMVDNSKVDFNPFRFEVVNLIAEKADLSELNTALGRIGTLESSSATITDLDTINGRIDNLSSDTAFIIALTTNEAFIDNLNSVYANIETVAAGKAMITNAFIDGARIVDLRGGYISSGMIDSYKVSIGASNGRMNISNNRIQIFDYKNGNVANGLFERIVLGNVNNDESVYGLRIRAQDGTTLLLKEDGITKEGFTDGYNKVDADSLDGAKLDISTVITSINNDNTTTLKGSKVFLNNSTLDLAFNEMKMSKTNDIYKVRYIRDYLNGNTANAGNHWVEIQAFSGTTNVAQNKIVTSSDGTTTNISRVVDNGTVSANYFSTNTNGLQYIQIDLGQVYTNIDYLQVYHYYSDGRTYHKNKTQVSQDGVNWFTLFDSDVSGEYVETSSGHRVNVNAGNIIYAHDASITANATEISLKVAKDSVISAINASAEQITINSAKLNLSGYVTITSLGTAGQVTINGGNISGGTLTLGGANNGNGTEVVKDASGNIIVTLDNTGVLVNNANYKLTGNGATYLINTLQNLIVDPSFEFLPNIASSYDATHGDYKADFDGVSGDSWIGSTANPRLMPYTGTNRKGIIFGNWAMGVNSTDYVYEYIKVLPLTTYTISGYASSHPTRNAAASTVQSKIQVKTYTSSGTLIATLAASLNTITTSHTAGSTDKTVRHTFTFTTPSNVNYIEVDFSSNGAAQWVIWDGCQCVEGSFPVIFQLDDSLSQLFNGKSTFNHLHGYEVDSQLFQIMKTDWSTGVNIYAGSSAPLRIETGFGYMDFGIQNSNYVDFYTSAINGFYFDKNIYCVGKFLDYVTGAGMGYGNEVWAKAGSALYVNYRGGSGLIVCNGAQTGAYGPIYGSSKNAITGTESFGEVVTYADESPNHIFCDRGRGEFDENGICQIFLDPIFLETVNTKSGDYWVQLTSFVDANAELVGLYSDYFIVKGTPYKQFMWEVSAERLGYERLRWNEADIYV